MANWVDYMSNPRSHYIKQSMFEVLKERYSQNEQIIERLGVSLLTESDCKGFLKLVSDIYEVAYMKAVNDHREQLEKIGLAAKVVPTSQS
jgi:hypothetical protein